MFYQNMHFWNIFSKILFSLDLPRPRKRLTDLLYKTSMESSDTDLQLWVQASKEWELRFRLTPAEVIETEGKVTGVKFYVNELQVGNLFMYKYA